MASTGSVGSSGGEAFHSLPPSVSGSADDVVMNVAGDAHAAAMAAIPRPHVRVGFAEEMEDFSLRYQLKGRIKFGSGIKDQVTINTIKKAHIRVKELLGITDVARPGSTSINWTARIVVYYTHEGKKEVSWTDEAMQSQGLSQEQIDEINRLKKEVDKKWLDKEKLAENTYSPTYHPDATGPVSGANNAFQRVTAQLQKLPDSKKKFYSAKIAKPMLETVTNDDHKKEGIRNTVGFDQVYFRMVKVVDSKIEQLEITRKTLEEAEAEHEEDLVNNQITLQNLKILKERLANIDKFALRAALVMGAGAIQANTYEEKKAIADRIVKGVKKLKDLKGKRNLEYLYDVGALVIDGTTHYRRYMGEAPIEGYVKNATVEHALFMMVSRVMENPGISEADLRKGTQPLFKQLPLSIVNECMQEVFSDKMKEHLTTLQGEIANVDVANLNISTLAKKAMLPQELIPARPAATGSGKAPDATAGRGMRSRMRRLLGR